MSGVSEEYLQDVYGEYELHADSANFPEWYTQLCYPCMPMAGLPQHPEAGTQPFFYIDAFYRRKFTLVASAQLTPPVGPLIYTGSNIAGWVPLFREQFPSVKDIIGLDLTPWYNEIARARHPDAEFRDGDLLKMDSAFPAAHTDIAIDEVVLDHFTYHTDYFEAAIEQFSRLLKVGGLLVLSGRVKEGAGKGGGWVKERVLDLVEPRGFRLVAFQDLTESSEVATQLMIRHVWGGDEHPAAIPEDEQKAHPDPTRDLRWELDRNVVRCKDRYKALVMYVFRKEAAVPPRPDCTQIVKQAPRQDVTPAAYRGFASRFGKK